MKENQQPITGLGKGDIAPTVFLCGDPERVPRISEGWDESNEVCRIREYVVHTGSKEGVPLSAVSTGIGGPSTGFIVEQCAALGGKMFIRIGNSGALADEIELGDYVITTGSVRDDGTTRSYVRPEYPAVACYGITGALVAAAEEAGARYHAGITWSTDGFYSRNKVLGEGDQLLPMSFNGYEQHGMNEMLMDMKRAGVLNIEMESGALLTLANLFGLRAGCICTVSDRAPWPGPGQEMISLDKNIQGAIDIATVAMLKLAAKVN